MSSDRKKISVIIPAYNEEACIDELVRRLQSVFAANSMYDFEALIVENGSSDSTWSKLETAHEEDGRFKVVRLSRNFRMDGGLTAGLHYATGDAAVLMTADLQDPPELITDFIKLWENGFENIYMRVTERQGTGLLRRINSVAFYWIASKLTGGAFPRNASDYRLVDRKVYEAVREMDERNRFVRGLFAWVGFKTASIESARPPRFAGSSSAHSLKVLDLAIKGIFSHSQLPLRLIVLVGILLSSLSFLSLVPLALLWLFVGVPFAGFGSLIASVFLMFGVLTFMIGITAEYVGLIYEEVKRRPNFIVRETRGL
jgi:glycosyltransferase involved in cell wall biosynthesis